MPMGDSGAATGCDICTHVVIAGIDTLKLGKYQNFSRNSIMHFQVSTYELLDSLKKTKDILSSRATVSFSIMTLNHGVRRLLI
jgi:hypothetical protein